MSARGKIHKEKLHRPSLTLDISHHIYQEEHEDYKKENAQDQRGDDHYRDIAHPYIDVTFTDKSTFDTTKDTKVLTLAYLFSFYDYT